MKPLLGPIGVLAAPRLVGDGWKQEDGGQDRTHLQQMLTHRLKGAVSTETRGHVSGRAVDCSASCSRDSLFLGTVAGMT